MSVIKTKTLDSKIAFISAPEITSGDENVNRITVLLDETWQIQDAEYFINFFTEDEKQGIINKLDVQENIGVCGIPNKVLERQGSFFFGLFAKAPDGRIKTSAVVQYRVGKGIDTQAGGKDIISLLALKNKFIQLINANTASGLLSPDMDFDNEIDPTFTNYMARIHTVESDYISYVDSYYNLICEFLEPDFEKIDDYSWAPLVYYFILYEYISGSVSQASYDSISEELDVSNNTIQTLQAELEMKNQTINSIQSVYENFYIGGALNGNT